MATGSNHSSSNRQRQQKQKSRQKKAQDTAGSENLLDFGDPDAWDDTALIAAYDETVRRARELALGGDSGGGRRVLGNISAKPSVPNEQSSVVPSGASTADVTAAAGGWQVGSLCRAVWSEDGLVYGARILSLEPDGVSCLVEYTDYGNREIQQLDDLLTPIDDHDDADAGADAADVDEAEDPVKPDGASRQLPQLSLPPPPVPRLPGEASDAIDDATYNMLMSWYMSGYYTGYYVGKRESGN